MNYRIFSVLLLLSMLLPAQDLWEWRTTDNFTIKDRIEYYPDAYVLHTVANIYFIKKFQDFGMTWWESDLTTFSLGIIWEVKDGFIPHEKVKYIGGDGFSATDIAVNTIVIAGNRLIKTTWKYFFPKYSINLQITYIRD